MSVRPPHIAAAAALAALAAATPAAAAAPTVATFVRAVDGDTVKVAIRGTAETVRLVGIDTPETVRPGYPVECGGKEASARIRQLLPAGATIRLYRDASQDDRDRYGRLLRVVGYHRQDVGWRLVREGWASVYVFRRPFLRVARYRRAEVAARREHRGAWKLCPAGPK